MEEIRLRFRPVLCAGRRHLHPISMRAINLLALITTTTINPDYTAPAAAQVPSDSGDTWQIPAAATASGPTDPDTPDSNANPSLFSEGGVSYLTRTSLSHRGIGVIVDPGSVWDLAGSEWAKVRGADCVS